MLDWGEGASQAKAREPIALLASDTLCLQPLHKQGAPEPTAQVLDARCTTATTYALRAMATSMSC